MTRAPSAPRRGRAAAMDRLPDGVRAIIMEKKAAAEKLRLSVYAFRGDAHAAAPGALARWVYVERGMSDPPGFATVTVAEDAILCRNERALRYVVRDAVQAALDVQALYNDDEIPTRDFEVYYTQGGDAEHPARHVGAETHAAIGRQFYFKMRPTFEDLADGGRGGRVFADVMEAIATLVLQA